MIFSEEQQRRLGELGAASEDLQAGFADSAERNRAFQRLESRLVTEQHERLDAPVSYTHLHCLYSVGGICGAGGMALLLGFLAPHLAMLVICLFMIALLAAFGRHFLPYGSEGETPLLSLIHI